jgi:hypothetical protein
MPDQILVTTTGTLDPVIFSDLGGISLPHPTVDFDLVLRVELQEIYRSVDVRTALADGHVTLEDENGNPITTDNFKLQEQAEKDRPGGYGGTGTGAGDMFKSTYDTDDNGIVDAAESIDGTTTANQYYGTDAGNTKGFYDFPPATGDMLKSTYDPTNVAGDAFSMGNMVETAGAKILTASERSSIIASAAHVGSTSNPHSVTKSQIGLGDVTNDAQLKRAAGDFNSFGEKLLPVGADIVLIEDSANGFAKQKLPLSHLLSAAGSVGFKWDFDNLTADADPGAGKFRFNAVSQGASSFIYVNRETGNLVNTLELLNKLSKSDCIYIQQRSSDNKFHLFEVTGYSIVSGNYVKIPVNSLSSGVNIDDTENCDWRILSQLRGYRDKTSRTTVTTFNSAAWGNHLSITTPNLPSSMTVRIKWFYQGRNSGTNFYQQVRINLTGATTDTFEFSDEEFTDSSAAVRYPRSGSWEFTLNAGVTTIDLDHKASATGDSQLYAAELIVEQEQ